MTRNEIYLVVGFTDSAGDLIEQLKKLPASNIVWVGEGKSPDPQPDVELVNVENPSLPSHVEEFTEDFDPKFIFLCPGAERDLVDLIEGDNLERLLYKEDMRLDGVPTIVISSEHHT